MIILSLTGEPSSLILSQHGNDTYIFPHWWHPALLSCPIRSPLGKQGCRLPGGDLSRESRRIRESRGCWSLSSRHPAGKTHGLAPSCLCGLLSTAGTEHLRSGNSSSLSFSPLPLHIFVTLQKSQTSSLTYCRRGFRATWGTAKGNHAWSAHRPHGQWVGSCTTLPYPPPQKGCRNASPLALHFERCVWPDS